MSARRKPGRIIVIAGGWAPERKALLYGGVALVAVSVVSAAVIGSVYLFGGADAVAGRFREAGLLPFVWLVSLWPLPAFAVALPPALAGAASLACALRPVWWKAARFCGCAAAVYAAAVCVGLALPAALAIPRGVPVGRGGGFPGLAAILCGLAFAFPLALPTLFVAYGAERVGSGLGE